MKIEREMETGTFLVYFFFVLFTYFTGILTFYNRDNVMRVFLVCFLVCLFVFVSI